MNVTELLVTGYNGNDPVFAVILAPGDATTVLTEVVGNREMTVDTVTQQTTGVFALVRDLLDGLSQGPGPA